MIERAGTGERVYLAIKAFLLAESDHRPGDRVDVADLTRRVGASATPVRAALHRMAGERLLVSHQGEGFSLPRITEPGLADLYQWNAALLVNALRSAPSNAPPPQPPRIDPAAEPILFLEGLFASLAAHCGNIEVEWAVAGAADRLHRPRRGELMLIPDFCEELRELARLVEVGDGSGVRQAIVAYHRKRLRLVPGLARLLAGLGDREPR
ncbi:GntR family transcriptional regulator [Caulobacter hibisci]|uniref:GntR family transcriptional regulator n=1 Tax=Caulobacter hibisci TaxID=2035993 RepID=A0ABS0SXR7_9CAUL|nr:GntR family transcriptional regulator [Caulobacter hibisci]MBI1684216.1 GntR family transcriptional regulator [Caulobacter hibisci]